MAGSGGLEKLKYGDLDALLAKDSQPAVNEHARAICDACNADSSWGGYYWAPAGSAVRARAHVWSKGRNDSQGRWNRMVLNIHAGSV